LATIKPTVEGNHIHLRCVYYCADASGQNIVTIATEAIQNYIMANCPIKPLASYLEGGMSGDKKANYSVLSGFRGKKVVVEVILPHSVVEHTCHCTAKQLVDGTMAGMLGLVMRGSITVNCHFANPLAAMFIALGQDPACASESHIGIGRTELVPEGVYCCATLPNLMCGTVGGGTKLPSQRACLEMMGCYGPNKANQLAEIMGAVVLAGEISLGSAVLSQDFAKAHKLLARETFEKINPETDSLEEAFDKAQALILKINKMPGKMEILKIYGFYKQATAGDCPANAPSLFSTDLKAKAKYEAWKKCHGMTKDEAKKEYINLIVNMLDKDQKEAEKK